MMERAFVIAAFGDRRKQVERLIKNIRSYCDLPIHILIDEQSKIGEYSVLNDNTLFYEFDSNTHIHFVTPQWTGPRAGVRNSNYHKVDFALNHHYDSLCMLDDDMYIINKHFIDGFAIAERFGAAIPINPRTYNCFNMLGADVRQEDIEEINTLKIPPTIPAVNFSPFFISPRHCSARSFLVYLKNELQNVPCRGTVAIIKAMWKTGYSPIILPEEWCVCGSNAKHIKSHTELLRGRSVNIPAIMLHLGHKIVQDVYGIK